MKTLSEYMMESVKSTHDIIPMGKLEWTFKSKEYGIDEHIKCDDWNAGFTTNHEHLVFWSPKFDWMPYVYLDEVKNGKTNWALVGFDCNPKDVATVVLTDFDKYRMGAATVPELDTINVPDEVEKMLKEMK